LGNEDIHHLKLTIPQFSESVGIIKQRKYIMRLGQEKSPEFVKISSRKKQRRQQITIYYTALGIRTGLWE
jgi:hypothetical protein